MKSINTHFTTREDLEKFIHENRIVDNSQLLIQVFSGICTKNEIQKFLYPFNFLFKEATIIGSTTDGEITDGKVSENRITLSFTSFTDTTLKATHTSGNESSFESGKKIANTLVKEDTKLIISFADGLNTNGEEYLAGINSVDKDIIVSGGLAGDNNTFTDTYVFLNNSIISNGAVAVSLSGNDLNVNIDSSFNWVGIGKELTITKVEKNRVYTIDDKTAVDSYAHYLGKDISAGLPAIGIEFPLIIKRNGVAIARAVVGKEDDGSLLFAGNLKNGDKVQLGYGNTQVLLSKAPLIYNRLKENPSEVIFVYSCMARRHFLAENIETEILPLQDIAPVSGFFTYGEFFTSGKQELHNQTMTVLSLSETNEVHKLKSISINIDKVDKRNTSLQALSHLIEVTSIENEKQKKDIQKQKEAFELLFEKASDGVLIIEDNHFVQCNEKIVVMLGYSSKEEVLNLHPSTLSPEFQADGKKSFKKAEEMMRLAISNNGHNFEWIHTRFSGEEFWVEVVLTPISLPDREIIHVVWRDITDRKKLETKLQNYTTKLEQNLSILDEKNKNLETQALYLKKSQEIAHIGVWEHTVASDYFYWSDEIYTIFGLNKENFQASNEKKNYAIHPDDKEEFEKEYDESIAEKRDYFSQHRIIRPDGTIHYTEERGEHIYENNKIIKTVGVILDITQRRKLEVKLSEINETLEQKVLQQVREITQAQKQFEAIFDAGMDGIAIIDFESNFLLVNSAYEEMLGMTKEELYKTSCINMTTPDMIEVSEQVLATVLTEGYYTGHQKQCISKSGQIIDVVIDMILMPDNETILLVLKDITQHNIDKKEIELKKQQLFTQSRMAQMGEMISMIAHQWRQPLGSISTTAANLKLKIELEAFDLETQDSRDECENYFTQRLNKINGYVKNLTTTIDDFRNFYKPDKEAESIRLDEVLSKSLSIIEASLSNDNIEVVKTSDSTQELEVYDNELMQVLLNILKNAQDNFKEKDIQNPKVTIEVHDTSISITDNGGGIPQDIIEKIFDPYFSTKDEKNGTGLGLYMSKTIIEEHHNGKLEVFNVDDGVCFRVSLGIGK